MAHYRKLLKPSYETPLTEQGHSELRPEFHHILPGNELLQAIHYAASRFYSLSDRQMMDLYGESTNRSKNRNVRMFKKFDESALIACGVLIEEYVNYLMEPSATPASDLEQSREQRLTNEQQIRADIPTESSGPADSEVISRSSQLGSASTLLSTLRPLAPQVPRSSEEEYTYEEEYEDLLHWTTKISSAPSASGFPPINSSSFLDSEAEVIIPVATKLSQRYLRYLRERKQKFSLKKKPSKLLLRRLVAEESGQQRKKRPEFKVRVRRKGKDRAKNGDNEVNSDSSYETVTRRKTEFLRPTACRSCKGPLGSYVRAVVKNPETNSDELIHFCGKCKKRLIKNGWQCCAYCYYIPSLRFDLYNKVPESFPSEHEPASTSSPHPSNNFKECPNPECRKFMELKTVRRFRELGVKEKVRLRLQEEQRMINEMSRVAEDDAEDMSRRSGGTDARSEEAMKELDQDDGVDADIEADE
ncbi:hypothetical protein BKA69DRAFT_1121885 [Paraphysoderma sedebokerense]|nr:hypothetical protein BKA69DRAFT_1121885 [Paraphysoderma sedebokerense]